MPRDIYEFGKFRLDPAHRRLERAGGEPVTLTAKPFNVLLHLVEHAGEPVSRKALIEAVWPDTVVEDNNLTQAISALRGALGKDYIATLPGRGYQFVGDVRTLGSIPASTSAHDSPSRGNEPGPQARTPRRRLPAAVALGIVALLMQTLNLIAERIVVCLDSLIPRGEIVHGFAKIANLTRRVKKIANLIGFKGILVRVCKVTKPVGKIVVH